MYSKYLQTTFICEDTTCVWKDGASAETSHLYLPAKSFCTSLKTTSFDPDKLTWNSQRKNTEGNLTLTLLQSPIPKYLFYGKLHLKYHLRTLHRPSTWKTRQYPLFKNYLPKYFFRFSQTYLFPDEQHIFKEILGYSNTIKKRRRSTRRPKEIDTVKYYTALFRYSFDERILVKSRRLFWPISPERH